MILAMDNPMNNSIKATSHGFLTVILLLVLLGIGSFYHSFFLIGIVFLISSVSLSFLLLEKNKEYPVKITFTTPISTYTKDQLIPLSVRITNSTNLEIQADLSLFLPSEATPIMSYPHHVVTLEPKEERTFSYIIIINKRGEFELGPVVMEKRDPFGVLRKRIAISSTLTIRVFPELLGSRKPKDYQRQVLSKMVSLFSTKIKGAGTDFFGLREYVRGDPIKIIDWKSSAKTGTLISKEFEDEKRLSVLMAMDVGSTMKGKKFEYAVTFMLELSRVLIDMNLQVGFIAFNDQLQRYLRPTESQKRYTQLWEQIYDLQVEDTFSNFKILSDIVLNEHFTRGMIFILTDSEGDIDAKTKEIRKLRLRNNHVVVLDMSTYNLNFKTALLDSSKHLDPLKEWLIRDVLSHDAAFLEIDRSTTFMNELQQIGCYYYYIKDPTISPFVLIDKLVRQEERRRR